MTKEEYLLLYQKYVSGKASASEIELLSLYKDDFDIANFDDNTLVPDQQLIKTRIYRQIESRLDFTPQRRTLRQFWWSVAASVLLLTCLGAYFVIHKSKSSDNQPLRVVSEKHLIVPGTNKAILILSNGEKIDLKMIANGRIAQDGSSQINKLKDGRLVYRGTYNVPGKVTYNTIVTPRGGQYQVTLPDGTNVWLNSASSFRFPTSFTGKARQVELNGEGYFEVAKNAHMPFTVNAGKVDIEVLGTHFNISAYNDDPSVKTTLLEGSVSLTGNDQKLLLFPGQQGVATKDRKGMVKKVVNTGDAIAWKNGFFAFRKEPLENAMRKIARWYDVDIVYQGKSNGKLLGGSVLRTQSIQEMLNYLETIGIAKFKIEGRRIMVKPN